MTTVWSYSMTRGGRSEAPLNWHIRVKVVVLTKEARSAVTLCHKIDSDGNAPATGAGQADSPTWGSCPGFFLVGRSGHAQGNRRGAARRLLCTGTEEKREGEGERGATQRKRGGERGGGVRCVWRSS
jgi:hypothetical protein